MAIGANPTSYRTETSRRTILHENTTSSTKQHCMLIAFGSEYFAAQNCNQTIRHWGICNVARHILQLSAACIQL